MKAYAIKVLHVSILNASRSIEVLGTSSINAHSPHKLQHTNNVPLAMEQP